jgi:ubiquitin-activating enzyme E1 C
MAEQLHDGECCPQTEANLLYTGDDSIYTYTFELEKKDDCPVCGGETASIEVAHDLTLEQFIEQLKGERLYVLLSESY